MKARDIMVEPVLTIKGSARVPELAKLLTERRVSGLPVVDDKGALIGIVSETDLMHRAETGTERRRKWWMQLFADSDTLARDFVKSHGTQVADIMSPFVITVSADADLSHIANVLDSNHIKRVPIMEKDVLVGIITRGDLVRRPDSHHLPLPTRRRQPQLDCAGYVHLLDRCRAVEGGACAPDLTRV
jgi:CBS-domain-containing membrane protein